MIKRIKKLPVYFLSLAVLLVSAIGLTIWCSKTESFLLLNSHHHPWLDECFVLLTNLGDGAFSIAIAAALLLFRKRKKGLTIILSYTCSGLTVQALKRIFHMPRPAAFFEQTSITYSNFIEGVQLYYSNSFPSGHTASAFALSTAMVLVYKKRKLSLLCLSLAALTGYSRIYLAQHFLQDVIAGAVLGTFFALFSYYQVYDQKILKAFKRLKRRKRLKAAHQQLGSA